MRALAAIVFAVLACLAGALVPVLSESQPVNGRYIYTLSNFTGAIPYNAARITVDRERTEIYVAYQNVIRIFNEAGMEVYRFGDDLDVGQILDVAIDDRGDILLLTYHDNVSSIIRCNYRGEPRSIITVHDRPRGFDDFVPNRMVFHRGQLFLVSTMGLKLAVTDPDGKVLKTVDLFPLLDLEEKDRGNVELGGVSVDDDGNVLMTVPVLFRAVVLSPDGKVRWFGKPSSAPGGFNVVAGIARDARGNFLVVDRLKGAILVFDRAFKFVTQFSTYGRKPDQLVFPDDLAVDGRGRVYVTQMGKKGISVFGLTYPG